MGFVHVRNCVLFDEMSHELSSLMASNIFLTWTHETQMRWEQHLLPAADAVETLAP